MFNIPNALSVFRLCLVPVLLGLAWSGQGRFFFALLVVSLASDGADGFLARKLNQTSPLGAKLDSWADLLTSLALPFCAWWLRPDVIRAEAVYLAIGILSYLGAIAFGFLKYGRLTSYHTWSGKVAAVLLGAVVLVLFAGGPGWPLRLVMPFVALTQFEEIAITALLGEWQANVPTLWHALKLRRQTRPANPLEPPQAPQAISR